MSNQSFRLTVTIPSVMQSDLFEDNLSETAGLKRSCSYCKEGVGDTAIAEMLEQNDTVTENKTTKVFLIRNLFEGCTKSGNLYFADKK